MPKYDGKGVALIIGAGDATGGAIAKKFAMQGYEAVSYTHLTLPTNREV